MGGDVTVHLGDRDTRLPENQALAVHSGAQAQALRLASQNGAHLVVLQGAPVQEQFVQKGPFVMSTLAEIEQVTAAYEAGQLGSIAE